MKAGKRWASRAQRPTAPGCTPKAQCFGARIYKHIYSYLHKDTKHGTLPALQNEPQNPAGPAPSSGSLGRGGSPGAASPSPLLTRTPGAGASGAAAPPASSFSSHAGPGSCHRRSPPAPVGSCAAPGCPSPPLPPPPPPPDPFAPCGT